MTRAAPEPLGQTSVECGGCFEYFDVPVVAGLMVLPEGCRWMERRMRNGGRDRHRLQPLCPECTAKGIE